jgi:opacity protein-like surface antigen
VKRYLLLVLTFTFAVDAFAAKKDFKGLFGSYRREKFTENEGNSSDFGMDFLLSTMLPLTPIVKSQETTDPNVQNSLSYSTFFDIEAGINYSFHYNWQFFLDVGYYTYETRRQNSVLTNPALPLFHQFDMTAIPLMLGARYRFSTEDIVPYVGLGVGPTYVKRKGFYDYNAVQLNEKHDTVISAEAIVGVEFYISSRAGIRLEASAYYMKLDAFTFNTGGSPGNFPILAYQGNPWSVRYASGVFILF